LSIVGKVGGNGNQQCNDRRSMFVRSARLLMQTKGLMEIVVLTVLLEKELYRRPRFPR